MCIGPLHALRTPCRKSRCSRVCLGSFVVAEPAPPPEQSCAGNFYTLVTGSNERRWNKMQDKLNTIIDSFTVGNSYVAET